ncbi:unnamed protein product, partial [marine sediment metagenome]
MPAPVEDARRRGVLKDRSALEAMDGEDHTGLTDGRD